MSKEVAVGCKLPSGLKFDLSDGRSVLIKGWNSAIVVYDTMSPIANGYAVTMVDADLWASVMVEWKDHAAIVSGVIFAVPSKDAFESEKKNRASVKSGFEQSPQKPGEKLA